MATRRWIAVVLTVAALAACDPDTPAKPNNLVGVAPSAVSSESVSPSPSVAPVIVPTTAPAVPVPVVTTKNPTPAKTKTTTKPPAPKTTAPAGGPVGNVHPGAFCSPEGAIGYTSAGTRMRCTRNAGENQPRWRAAS
ncbi:hypothetical protein ACPPVO_01380 [Dactylosporangium sp. McL0621]|uniref:hypothetical protein n=1 Tax=Dactylosporangium sp. McL0621 TaxID=3415678 RepID=UPI003CF072C3